jgi:hypothetical protein
MSTQLKQMISVLNFISKISDKRLRQANLKYISRDPRIYVVLREIAHNAVKGNIKVPPTVIKQLNCDKYKRVLLGLAKKQKSKKKQRQLVEQSGGFLPLVLPAVFSIIESLT